MRNKTKVGIVGCGYVSSLYMSTFNEHETLELAGAYDQNPERLRNFCNFYTAKAFNSRDELIDGCDLVVNLTSPESHYGISKATLVKGKPVYCEKPLTLSQEQDAELVRVAVEKGTNIFGAPCVYLSRIAETVEHSLNDGRLGKVYAVYAEMDNDQVHRKEYENWKNEIGVSWPAKNEFESGATIEHASYTLSLLERWFGAGETQFVYQNECITDKIIPIHKHTADFSCALIRYPNNIVARVTCSIVAPRDHSIRIFSENGVLTVKDIWFYDTPVYWQNFFTFRNTTRLNPIKRKLRPAPYAYPLGRKTYSARMDFCRGIVELARTQGSDIKTMESLLKINDTALRMNGPSSSEKQHGWEILGTGAMANRYHDALVRNGYTVSGVYSQKPDRAFQFTESRGVKTSHTSLDSIPQAGESTRAYIASNNIDHYTQIKEMIGKGYNVLAEKPLTLCPKETEELYALADDNNLRLQENLWSLFTPAAREIKKDCTPLDYLELRFCSPIPYASDKRQWDIKQGGCLYDLGIYCFAWAVYLLGEIDSFKVTDVRVEHSVISEISLTLTHKNNSRSNIKAGFHTEEQYVKTENQYYFPIFAPEYKSSIKHPFFWKIKQKLTGKDFPAKDPYSYILDSMNGSLSETTPNPHPPSSSKHIARIMKDVSVDCLKAVGGDL